MAVCFKKPLRLRRLSWGRILRGFRDLASPLQTMADIHTIRDLDGDDGVVGAQAANQGGGGGGYRNPMLMCCARIPIVTILMASVEFLLWFIFVFIDGSIWVSQTCTDPSGIARGEVWRLLTPSILHYGYFQIFFDLIFMFMMGVQVEQRVGSICFIWLSVLFTILTYLLNVALSGFPFWAFGFSTFYTYCQFGIYPLLSCLMILQLRLSGAKWTSFFMIFPMPSALLPFVFVGLCLLFSFSYVPIMLLLSGAAIGFLTWTGVLRFLVPPASCLRAWETRCCLKLSRWPHWANASVSDDVRHFPLKMGEGPEPMTCCCNRWKPPQMGMDGNGDVENGGMVNYGQQTHTQTMNAAAGDRGLDGIDSKKSKKNKNKNKKKKSKKGSKVISCDTSTSSLESWGGVKGKGKAVGTGLDRDIDRDIDREEEEDISVRPVSLSPPAQPKPNPNPNTYTYSTSKPSNPNPKPKTKTKPKPKTKDKKANDGFSGKAHHL